MARACTKAGSVPRQNLRSSACTGIYLGKSSYIENNWVNGQKETVNAHPENVPTKIKVKEPRVLLNTYTFSSFFPW